MKALSLRQPWLWVVLHGKTIENRVWNTHYRGRFLLHASKGMTRCEYENARAFCEPVWETLGQDPDQMPAFDSPLLARGRIAGIATITDVVPPALWRTDAVDAASSSRRHRLMHYGTALTDNGDWRWHMKEQYGFVLSDVRALAFTVPWSATQRWFDVPLESPVMKMLHEAGDLR